MEVNVKFRYGLRLMEECGNGGRVVNMGSVAGLGATTMKGGYYGHYGVSKDCFDTSVVLIDCRFKIQTLINIVITVTVCFAWYDTDCCT